MNQLTALLSTITQGAGFEDPASLKRFITATLGVGAVALHDKFGVSLSDAQINDITAITVAYVVGSNYLAAAKKKAAVEADKIKTAEDADKAAVSTPRGGIAPLLALAVFAAVLFGAAPARAQDTVISDVPVVMAVDAGTLDRSEELVKLDKGQVAPFDGRLYSNALHIDTQREKTYLKTTLKEVEPKVGIPVWQSVLITVGAVLLTATIAVPVGVEIGKKTTPK